MRASSWYRAGAAALALLAHARVARAGSAVEAPSVQSDDDAPAGYYPPPPPLGVYRPFSLTVAAGPGALFGPGERDLALSHNLARFGWAVATNLSLVLGYEGAGAPSVNPATGDDSWLRQDVFAVGVQHHFGLQLYYRGSAGLGFVSESTARRTFSGGRGLALSAAVGYEAVQWPRAACGFELVASNTIYRTESWRTIALHLTLAMF